jgi:PAS domain S-box-containing protein
MAKEKFIIMDAGDKTKHPRTIGWIGTTALAMGGSNQSLFLIAGATGLVASQGSAAIPLLALGLLLSWMAAPGWTELILMWPNRVGGIAATCAEAFRPYSPVLANLTGTCYWWGWVPTCGLTALLSASAIHEWYLPHTPVPALAVGLVMAFTGVNLCGVKWVTRLVIPIATISAILAFLSGLLPIITGHVDWHQASTFHLISPFPGLFGGVTSAMAGLYLIGFAAPAFEAASCHVGETVDPIRNVPRAMLASALMASVYFLLLPVVWLGVLGPNGLSQDLMLTLGPTFAPLLGGAARATAIWFIMFNMFHGTIQPLAGASRTLSQMSEDGLLPRFLARRSRNDTPWAATLLTAGMSIIFLLIGDPVWMIAAANLTYLIGIALPSVAVWLLRMNAPHMVRPYRAPNWTISLGVVAALVWAAATVLGFEQFGLPTVLFGLALAYSGSALYALRRWQDRRHENKSGVRFSLHAKLTGAMLLVLTMDGGGYLLAIGSIQNENPARVTALEDIFVAVALLTITVGLVLPGMISHAAEEVSGAAKHLAEGTLADFSQAMRALGDGRLDDAYVRMDICPITIHSRDEMAVMADSFNVMQNEIAQAVDGLDEAREGLRSADATLKARMADLRESRERFEVAVQGSHDGLWDWDIAHSTVYFSPRWKAILGYSDQEIPNLFSEWEERIHADDRAHVHTNLQQYLQGALSHYEIEFRMHHQNGSLRWILARGAALRDTAGRAYRMAGSHTDITDRKRAEESQLRLANYNRLLLESSGEGVYGIDTDGSCTFINLAGARMLGLSVEEIMGRNMHIFTHHSLADGTLYPVSHCPIYQTFHTGVGCRVDTEVFWRADGTAFASEYSASPIWENETIQGAVVTFTDISERRQAQQELLRAKQAAEAASVAKSQFLANMSHELRTPMNAILGFAEMVQDQTFGGLNSRQARYVDNILTGGRHLMQLINDILDLAKVETGHMTLEHQIIDVAETLHGAYTIAQALAVKKGVVLSIGIEASLRPLAADSARIKQILYNLLSNAIKFTPEGGTVHLEAQDRGGVLEVAVIDMGIGLESQDILRIFQEFEQVDSSYTRKQQGTGLGLSLTRQLVERHGGQVWAESEGLGHGSTFRFTIPWTPAATTIQKSVSTSNTAESNTAESNTAERAA